MIRLKRRPGSKPQISIAPLVDCVFLLLMFFLLASTFSRGDAEGREGLEIELPGARSGEPEEDKVIRVFVADSGEIRLESRVVPLGELTVVLQATVREHGHRPLFLVADRRVRLGIVTEVIDKARSVGLPSVCIATRKPSDDSSPSEGETSR
jgi:biopolymer transport protein ExbD